MKRKIQKLLMKKINTAVVLFYSSSVYNAQHPKSFPFLLVLMFIALCSGKQSLISIFYTSLCLIKINLWFFLYAFFSFFSCSRLVFFYFFFYWWIRNTGRAADVFNINLDWILFKKYINHKNNCIFNYRIKKLDSLTNLLLTN